MDEHWIDSGDLAAAVEAEADRESLDFRTRLLIRDSVEALRDHWGAQRWNQWFQHLGAKPRIEQICQEDLGPAGFPFLRYQVMEPTRPETIRQFFRDIGTQLHKPVRIEVGGSASLILKGMLSRGTQDIDVVDEVPKEIRDLGDRLKNIERLHRLQIAHFQQHYLPSGWNRRLQGLEPFGELRVYLCDPYDIFLSKLTSIRDKDKEDLLVLSKALDKEVLSRRLRETRQSALAAEDLKKCCEQNWYVLFGEPLPS